jgi:hypothetical protein
VQLGIEADDNVCVLRGELIAAEAHDRRPDQPLRGVSGRSCKKGPLGPPPRRPCVNQPPLAASR